MPSHIAILPSGLPEQAHSAALGRARLAEAYGKLPPAALMLLAVISVELSWAVATLVLADVGECGTAWLSTAFAAVVFTVLSPPKVDARLRKHWHLVVLFGLTDAAMTLPFLLALR
jgi:threonine/homoserine efflux transporter RhtA